MRFVEWRLACKIAEVFKMYELTGDLDLSCPQNTAELDCLVLFFK